MTARAERVYLSFYESDEEDNAQRLARVIRQSINEAMKESAGANSPAFLLYELYNITDELEDPNLLTQIYGS